MRLSLVLALGLLVTVPARAQSPLEAEAKAHFASAQKAFDAARYAQALDEYQQSYALSRYPAILYRVALCQDLLARRADAVTSYQRYLDADPGTARREAVEARMKELQASAPPAVDKPAADSLPALPPSYTASAPAPTVSAPPARPAHAGRSKKIAGVVLLAGGAVLIAVGGYASWQVGDAAATVNRAIANGGTFDARLQSVEQTGHDAQLEAGVLYGIGAAAVATGALLTALGFRAERSTRGVSLAPLPGGGAVSWQGRF